MRFPKTVLLLPLLLSCSGQNSYHPHVPEKGKKSWTAYVCSDPHYFPSSLHDDGMMFRAVTEENGDGKMVAYSDVLFSAFLEETIEGKPDAMILSGDITFNGETTSHQEVAQGLKKLLEKGIQPLVAPGNHDIDTHVAYRYEGEEAFPIASPTVKEFRNLYFPFGLEQSFQRMDGAFSYAYQAAEDLIVLAVDGNFSRYYEVGKDGLAFVEDVLKKAKRDGKKVLPFSHQSALLHNERFQTSYAMNDHEALSALYRDYDVSLSLAGHWHIQHIQDGDGFDEILTSPLCLLENSYAILKYEDGAFSYSKKRLDMAFYAKRHGLEDPIYLDFQQASYDFFDKMGKRNFSPDNIPEGMDEEDYLAIRNAFLHFNRSYFIGEKVDLSFYQEEISLFKKYPNYPLCSYLSSILNEFENDDRVYPN